VSEGPSEFRFSGQLIQTVMIPSSRGSMSTPFDAS
jgi:hypothetical protein